MCVCMYVSVDSRQVRTQNDVLHTRQLGSTNCWWARLRQEGQHSPGVEVSHLYDVGCDKASCEQVPHTRQRPADARMHARWVGVKGAKGGGFG